MKILSMLFSAIFCTSFAFGGPKSTSPVLINPESLRTNLLRRNIDLALALNNVQKAKAQVAEARGSLLPSVNLGGVISSGPSFMLSSVSYLLPFLMPSKWINLSANNELLKAQTSAYYLARLNVFASAYSTYVTILSDIQLRQNLLNQFETLKALEEKMRLPAEMGIVRKEDYLEAQARAQMALVQVSQVDTLIKKETAAMRQMLGLELDQEIIFAPLDISAPSIAEFTPQELLEKTHESSPEAQQINSLIKAAQLSSWSTAFSFISGSTLNSGRSAAQDSFGPLTQSGSINLGFGYFPALEISNLNVQQMRLRKQEIRLEQAQLIEDTLGALQESQLQLAAAEQAEQNMRKIFEAEYMRYLVGMTDILHVFQAETAVSNATVARVRAKSTLNSLAITLHRIRITDEFAKLEKCEVKSRQGQGLSGKIGRILNPNKYQVTLDQACRK